MREQDMLRVVELGGEKGASGNAMGRRVESGKSVEAFEGKAERIRELIYTISFRE